jgi:hypothetical protein
MENPEAKLFLISETQVDGTSNFANHHIEAFILTKFLSYEFNHHHPYCSWRHRDSFSFCSYRNLQQASNTQKSF